VLIFLSGVKEIETMYDTLLAQREINCSPAARDWVLPLHGSLPPEEQRRVFQRPPSGVRKIVLATNVAETSITIDDVGYVIDTARMKERRYDPVRRLASLEDCMISRANARQRRGRAGRVAPGVAVHLFSSHTHVRPPPVLSGHAASLTPY
jgi:HrpA-like RNA helicase